MKKIILLLVYLLLISNKAYSDHDDTNVITLSESKSLTHEKPAKGKRTPGKTETCIIDFNNATIHITITSDITCYELWDEEGESMLASYSTDSEMVLFMTQQTGIFQLRVVTTDSIYIGYIEL